jgi:hypothetical protein
VETFFPSIHFDRLGAAEVHQHLTNGARDLYRWLEGYRVEPNRT